MYGSGPPKIRGYATCDIRLSRAIFFSSNPPKKAFRLFKSISIRCHSRRSFCRHQDNHLHPIVKQLWDTQQQELLQEVKEDGLLIGGNASCDSMDHSGKYGS